MNKLEQYYQELPEKIRILLKAPDEERIKFIKKPKFIHHIKAQKIFEKLDALLNTPPAPRIRSLMILGDSNNGKTMIMKKFQELKKKLPDENNPNPLEYENPVLYIQAPVKASLKDLYNSIFISFKVPFKANESYSEKEAKIKHYCSINGIKMLIIDEIQGGTIGSPRQQREFVNGIKNISNLLEIPIVLVGIPSAIGLVNSDHQLKSRFVPTKIKKWDFDEDYLSLLYSIEMTLPLKKPSYIYENENLAKNILELSNGLIGDIVEICNLLAIEAINSKKEKIENSMLRKIPFIPVSSQTGVLYAEEI
jgi:hypothetical protein